MGEEGAWGGGVRRGGLGRGWEKRGLGERVGEEGAWGEGGRRGGLGRGWEKRGLGEGWEKRGLGEGVGEEGLGEGVGRGRGGSRRGWEGEGTGQTFTITRPHRDHTPCVWRPCRPSYIKLLLFMSLFVYGCGPSANSFRLIMAADRLVWLARPFHKRPEARKGMDHLQRLESVVLMASTWLLQLVSIYSLFSGNLSFRSHTSP